MRALILAAALAVATPALAGNLGSTVTIGSGGLPPARPANLGGKSTDGGKAALTPREERTLRELQSAQTRATCGSGCQRRAARARAELGVSRHDPENPTARNDRIEAITGGARK